MSKYREVPRGPEFKEGEERPETKVILHFIRHEEKEKRAEGQPDAEVELTKKGREKVIERGKKEPAQPEVAWSAGSELIRSAHTALLRMAAANAELTPEMNFEEARKMVEKELKYGKKLACLPELRFYWDGTPEFGEKGDEAFDEGRGLEFLLKESDDLVKRLKDKDSTSYLRAAAGYASLIAREMVVGNNFNQVVVRKPEKYKKYGNRLERYLGSHQSVLELFYMRVLEKIGGRKKAEEFIEAFRDDKGRANGLDFHEGYDVTINNGPEGQKVILEGIRGFEDVELTPKILEDIIVDAEKLDEEISKI